MKACQVYIKYKLTSINNNINEMNITETKKGKEVKMVKFQA